MTYRLESCVWEITLNCCFSCRYCGSKGGHARENELTTEECLNLAKQLCELGCKRISMIGGEVFMRKDWHTIAAQITALGMGLNIITNGFVFSEDILSKLKEIDIESIAVSIDGTRDIHDRYRMPGSFDRAVNAVKQLSAANIPVSVISTLNSENVNTLPGLLAELKNLPIFAWQLQACSPMGNAADNEFDYRFDFNQVIDFVKKNMNDVPFMLGIADNIGYFTPGEGKLRGNKSGVAFFTGCRAGLSSIGIDSIGNIRGCESMYDDKFIEGNIREISLREIWEKPGAFAYNREYTRHLLTGKCAECSVSDYCGGGCRSYNHFVHGKLYESPFCARTEE